MVHGHFRRLSVLKAVEMEVVESRAALAAGKNDEARVYLARALKSIEQVTGELARLLKNAETGGF